MNKILTLIAALVLCCTSAMAGSRANALRLTLKANGADPVEVLFTAAPTLTYSADHTRFTLSAAGMADVTYALSEVRNIRFFNTEDPEAIVNVFTDETTTPENRGIYTLDGRRVEAPTTPGTYIINGRKVLVK